MHCFPRFVVLMLLVSALAGCNSGSAPAPLVVGHVSDLSRADHAGLHAEYGMRLALHELAKDGAISDAFQGRAVQVRHTDAHGDLDAFESQAVRLDAVNRCVALMGGLSAKEVAALDHVKLPLVTFHGQPVPGVSSQVFYLGLSATRQAEVLAKTLAKSEPEKIAMLVDERRADRSLLAATLERTLAAAERAEDQAPIQVTSIRYGKEANWRELADRINALAPNAIVFAGDVQDFNACIARFSVKTSSKVQWIYAGNDGDHRRFEVDVLGQRSVVIASAFFADARDPKIEAFMKAYREMPHQAEADVHAAVAYDALRILVDAMKRAAPNPTPDRIHAELTRTKDFEGLTGPLTMNAERQLQRRVYIVRWTGGKLALVDSVP